eukprot:COSAG03_NODE_25910_length_262_cov_1.588957_1_plen_38_part_10
MCVWITCFARNSTTSGPAGGVTWCARARCRGRCLCVSA